MEKFACLVPYKTPSTMFRIHKLEKNIRVSGQRDLIEFKQIAIRFEGKIFAASTSQQLSEGEVRGVVQATAKLKDSTQSI
ncbi:hypothetical protein CCACVL1_04139 [Corchorus capsularis]|uniref:Mediator complex subunit 15 KIX domain-containing protein n=1 Tax=Corchorus capsularis TaxID=210143 RepID=A0A1R3JUW8_COCAP|nr:hypothetical protein CCACVL1_04139 [Corchorus capsularis]